MVTKAKFFISVLLVMFLITGLILLFSKDNMAQSQDLAQNPAQSGDLPFNGDIKAIIRHYSQEWGLNEQRMLKIAFCESSYRQFDKNGKVLQGHVNKWDTGVFQINLDPEETDWQFVADLTGYDPYETEGNIRLAMWIAQNSGYHHWRFSGSCQTN